MPVYKETLGALGWPGGVVLSTDDTLLNSLSSPRGKNSALAKSTQGIPYVQKRTGLTTHNQTAITGTPRILGQHEFRAVSTGTLYHLIVGDDGGLYKRGTAAIDTIDATAFTAGTHYPDFVVSENLCFIVNGQDRLKLHGDGTTITNFGITRPTVGTMAGVAGAAGLHNGTYELRVAFGNSSTGAISSASNTASSTVTVSNEEISWSNIPVSADPQVDQRLLLVRNTATMPVFFVAHTISNNVDTTATTSIEDDDLITPAPSTTSNDPPPTGSKFLALYQDLIFVATEDDLYYSTRTQHEAFDLDQRIEHFNDGQKITGLYADFGVLLVFKEDRVYVLRGDDPAVWTITVLDSVHGCGSHRAVVSGGDGKIYWWGRKGLARWDGLSSAADAIGSRLFGDPTEKVNYDEILVSSAAYDPLHDRALFALPGIGQSTADFIIPFNTLIEAFESDYWDPMDASDLTTVADTDETPYIWLGGYHGQIFKFASANNDGVVTGTASGTFIASAATITDLEDTTATFDTTGQGLIDRKLTIVDADGNIMTTDPRPTISANTATTLTFSSVSGLQAGTEYTYIIGGPNFSWDTPWMTFENEWIKKRFEYFFALTRGVAAGVSARAEISMDYDDFTNATSTAFQVGAAGSLWDVALWDVDVWSLPTNRPHRFRVGRVGFAWKMRVRDAEVNQPFALLRMGTQAVLQTVKT